MKMENETKLVAPDYKNIRKMSQRIDCTIAEADFSTNRPNTNRISYVASDINRFLKYGSGGSFYGFKY
jgi:hypothetical protein